MCISCLSKGWGYGTALTHIRTLLGGNILTPSHLIVGSSSKPNGGVSAGKSNSFALMLPRAVRLTATKSLDGLHATNSVSTEPAVRGAHSLRSFYGRTGIPVSSHEFRSLQVYLHLMKTMRQASVNIWM